MRNRPLYAFDAEADAMQRWHEVSFKVSEELQNNRISPLFNVGGLSATEVTPSNFGAVNVS